MKNKKGFTLIELLAVIVILAIIALIATPIILNMITKARKNAARSSALGYIDAIEYKNGFASIGTEGYTAIESGDVTNINVKLKGQKPTSGTITVDKDGKVTKAENLCINGYIVNYDGQDATVGNKCNGESSTPKVQPKSFDKDDWSVIAANTTSNVYQVGDTKCVALSGLTTTNDNGCENGEFKVRIANKTACTTETSQTACGFVVEFVDIIGPHKMNSTATNAGGYPASELYNDYFASNATNSLYAKLPSDLQSKIINTTVVSGHGSRSGETNFTSNDKLYLLSTKEIGLDVEFDTAKSESRILDYYNVNNINKTREKLYRGVTFGWWLRSAYSSANGAFLHVNSTGVGNYPSNSTTFNMGVAPAFRIG